LSAARATIGRAATPPSFHSERQSDRVAAVQEFNALRTDQGRIG
jgi:hypothetical protein